MLVVLADSAFRLVPIARVISVGHLPLFALISLAALMASFSDAHFVRQVDLLGDSLPDHIDAVSVVEPLKNTVTADHDKIEVVLYFEALDIWIANNDVGVSSISWSFGFDVSERLGHRESTREYSQRPLNVEILLTRVRSCFGEGLSSIYLAPGGLDSDLLKFVVGLVVSGENTDLGSSVYRHDGPRVADVDDVYHVVNDHDDVGARPGSLGTHVLSGHQVLGPGLSLLDEREEVAFAFSEALLDSLDRILWELLILNDEVVEVISQIVGTSGTTMSVEYSKEADLWPVDVKVGLVLGLQNVEDDRDAVFVVVSDDALVGVGGVRLDDSTLFLTCFRRLVILELDGSGI